MILEIKEIKRDFKHNRKKCFENSTFSILFVKIYLKRIKWNSKQSFAYFEKRVMI